MRPAQTETVLVRRSYIFYSLVLAIIYVETNRPDFVPEGFDCTRLAIHPNSEQNLLAISDALISEDESGTFDEFLKASREKTNTWDQRQRRIKWLATALTRSEW